KYAGGPASKSRKRNPAEWQPDDEKDQRQRGVHDRERVPREPRRPEHRARDSWKRGEIPQHRKEQPHQVAEDGEGEDRATAARVNAQQRANRDEVERRENRECEEKEQKATQWTAHYNSSAWLI